MGIDDKKSVREKAVEVVESTKNKLTPANLKRTVKKQSDDGELDLGQSASVSAGPIDKVIELAFNPSRDKIREVTIIDRLQGRMFPQLDMINTGRHYCLEIAAFRQNPQLYKSVFKRERPAPPDLLDEFMFRSAQWQKSVAGKNLERATDIALAETEVRAGEEEESNGRDAWKE